MWGRLGKPRADGALKYQTTRAWSSEGSPFNSTLEARLRKKTLLPFIKMNSRINQLLVLTSFFASTTVSRASNGTANNLIVSIPPSDTVVLPPTFSSNYSLSFVDTVLPPSSSVNSLLAHADNATFISYSQAFLNILGSSPSVRRIAGPLEAEFAYEAGVYVPELNSVWFTGSDPTETSLTSFQSPRIVLNINLNNHDRNTAKARIARLIDAFKKDGTRITDNLDFVVDA